MMTQTLPLISIIVPVYKVEKYLHRCIDSILAQTFENFELILVDDGSPDNSGIICDEYAQKDNRIKVVHKENEGVSKTRNIGISMSKGSHICFIDSDDYIENHYIRNLILYKDIDLVIDGFKTKQHCTYLSKSFYNDNNFKDFWDSHFHRLYSTVPWGKLYKTSIIKNNHIEFDTSVRLGEDLLFNLEYLKKCRSIQLIKESSYIYTTNTSSSERYNISENELIYTLERIKRLASDLTIIHNCECSPRLLHRTIVATYPLKKIFDNRLDFYYKTYQSYFPDNSKLTFYEDEICSPIKRGIRLIKELAILNQNKDYIETILQLKKHFNSQLDKIHFTSKLDKLIAILIKHNLLKTVKLILSFKKGL